MKNTHPQQKSILSFFSSQSGSQSSNKRVHSEMLRGEYDNTKQNPQKKFKLDIDDKVSYHAF